MNLVKLIKEFFLNMYNFVRNLICTKYMKDLKNWDGFMYYIFLIVFLLVFIIIGYYAYGYFYGPTFSTSEITIIKDELPLNTPEIDNSKISNSSSISKKKIIIGVTIGAIVVCGVGAGIFFIPGAPELIISTVLFCSNNGGFGGA